MKTLLAVLLSGISIELYGNGLWDAKRLEELCDDKGVRIVYRIYCDRALEPDGEMIFKFRVDEKSPEEEWTFVKSVLVVISSRADDEKLQTEEAFIISEPAAQEIFDLIQASEVFELGDDTVPYLRAINLGAFDETMIYAEEYVAGRYRATTRALSESAPMQYLCGGLDSIIDEIKRRDGTKIQQVAAGNLR